MKFFIDTANIEEIKKAWDLGVIDGVTTNPFGTGIVNEIIEIYENYMFDTEVIVASVRNPLHVVEAAKMGAHIATIPYSVII